MHNEQLTGATISRLIHRAADQSHDEAALRERVHPLWERYLREQGSDLALQFRHERVLANGRSDTVFNRLVLEYKRPGSLGKKRQVAHVQTQLRLYIEDLARADGWKKERLLGVAFDGEHFVYLKYLGRWIQGSAIPVTPESVDEFLTYLVKLTERAALIPENLLRDFAVAARDGESLAGNSIQALFGAIGHHRRSSARASNFQRL